MGSTERQGGPPAGKGGGAWPSFSQSAVGEEGLASIRRPSTWNSVVGIRPTAGMVSRSGMFDGWPELNGSLGPMARTVTDVAKLLDVMAGYDPEDPLTASGVGHVPGSYTKFLDKNGLKGAHIGVLREPMGRDSEPQSQDFAKITAVFDTAVGELKTAGATGADPIVIPNLKKLLDTRAEGPTDSAEAFKVFFGRSAHPPFKTKEEMMRSPDFAKVFRYAQERMRATSDETKHYRYLQARQELMLSILKVMADNKLDAIVYK